MLTRNPGSSKPSRTVDRAGGSSGKNSRYASFMAAKSPGSERRTVVRTTERRPRSSSSRIDWMFRRHWRVCPPMAAAAHSPDIAPGRSGACPERKTRPLATTQWEYGPTGFGWLGNSGIPFMIRRRGNAAGPKRIVTLGGPSEGSQIPRRALGTNRNFQFCRCKSIRNWDVVQGGNRTDRRNPLRWNVEMSKRDLALRVGGAAGDGVSSTAESFAKISARSGLHTWTYSSYQSVIRGGHVWTQVRGGLDPLLSHGDDPDVVLCLNQQTMDVHQADVPEDGAIIYDVDSVKPDPTKIRKNVRLIGIPLRKKAQTLSPNALMRNTVALGAAVQLFDMDFRHVESAFKDIWGDKKPEVAQQNLQAAKLGASAVVEMGGSLHLGLAYTNEAKYLMTGNEALCLGALAAGVKFLAQYPMTPASSILHWMALHGPKYGVVVKQVEDELSAMNMAVGAGFAGVRSMTATSGGGFSLMVEAIGQAGMTETPLVAVLVQRSGPSTGLPTKTEQ